MRNNGNGSSLQPCVDVCVDVCVGGCKHVRTPAFDSSTHVWRACRDTIDFASCYFALRSATLCHSSSMLCFPCFSYITYCLFVLLLVCYQSTLCDVILCHQLHLCSDDLSYRVRLCYVMTFHVMLRRIRSGHAMWCHVMPHRATSCHTVAWCFLMLRSYGKTVPFGKTSRSMTSLASSSMPTLVFSQSTCHILRIRKGWQKIEIPYSDRLYQNHIKSQHRKQSQEMSRVVRTVGIAWHRINGTHVCIEL